MATPPIRSRSGSVSNSGSPRVTGQVSEDSRNESEKVAPDTAAGSWKEDVVIDVLELSRDSAEAGSAHESSSSDESSSSYGYGYGSSQESSSSQEARPAKKGTEFRGGETEKEMKAAGRAKEKAEKQLRATAAVQQQAAQRPVQDWSPPTVSEVSLLGGAITLVGGIVTGITYGATKDDPVPAYITPRFANGTWLLANGDEFAAAAATREIAVPAAAVASGFVTLVVGMLAILRSRNII